jgi:hypothetical protein
MKKLMALALTSALVLAAAPALAADAPAKTTTASTATAAPAENSQNNKMKECQAKAGEKKLEGKDRQAYVNNCLKAKPEKAESKMAMCNKKTAGLKGDERNKAQSECMKAS